MSWGSGPRSLIRMKYGACYANKKFHLFLCKTNIIQLRKQMLLNTWLYYGARWRTALVSAVGWTAHHCPPCFISRATGLFCSLFRQGLSMLTSSCPLQGGREAQSRIAEAHLEWQKLCDTIKHSQLDRNEPVLINNPMQSKISPSNSFALKRLVLTPSYTSMVSSKSPKSQHCYNMSHLLPVC